MRFLPTILILSILCAGILLAVVIMAPSAQKSAHIESDGPLIVRGYVRDSSALPVPGAEVEVSVKQDDTVRATYTDTTDAAGLYDVTFGYTEWDPGNTILVVAEFGGDLVENSTVANEDPVQYVDVTMTIAIPEFSDIGKMLSIVGTLGAFIMVFFARKKKHG